MITIENKKEDNEKILVKCDVCSYRDHPKNRTPCSVCSDNKLYISHYSEDPIVTTMRQYWHIDENKELFEEAT